MTIGAPVAVAVGAVGPVEVAASGPLRLRERAGGHFPGAVSVTLQYDIYYRYRDGDDATIEVFDGGAWQTVWTAPTGTALGRHTLDVSAHAVGNPSFRVRFSYQNAAYDHWFAVDNVVVTANVGASCTTRSASVVTVPDGGEGGTEPMRVSKSGSDLQISWDVATSACASTDYHLIWGRGADLSGYHVSGSDCTLAASGTHLWTTAPDTSTDWVWFLVVGRDGVATEGGWGTDSSSCLMRPTISSNSSWRSSWVWPKTVSRYAFSASRYSITSGLSRSRSQ